MGKTVFGPRSSVLGPRSSVLGPRSSVFGPRSSVFGLRSSVFGLETLTTVDKFTKVDSDTRSQSQNEEGLPLLSMQGTTVRFRHDLPQ